MKFTISKPAFQDLLQVVLSAVPSKSTLPILSNVLIQADKEGLTLMATDLDISIRTKGEAEVKTAGSVTVPAKRIGEIVRELPDTDVHVELKDKKIHLACGNGSFVIVCMDPEDFPQLPQVDADKTVSLDTDILEKAVRRTAYAVSSDESRQMLTGVLLQFKGGELRMVGTDGHRLAKATFKGAFTGLEGRDLIIPPKALNQVVRLASGHAKVKLSVSKNFAVFEVGATTIYSRLIDGNFPNYEQVIPKNNTKTFDVKREDLMSVLRRVSILADGVTRQVKMSLKPERVEFSVSTADVGEGREPIGIAYTGEPVDIGFNAAYLLEAMRTMSGDAVRFSVNTSTSPGVMIPVEGGKDEELVCLVMPLRLAES
jgi:DNA polymerase-3 subunit beta